MIANLTQDAMNGVCRNPFALIPDWWIIAIAGLGLVSWLLGLLIRRFAHDL